MAINNTFDQLDGVDQSEREAAEARALEVGSRLVDEQEAANQERFARNREVDQEARFAGKYKSAEDLERAYLELQKKLGERSTEEVEDEPQEAQEEAPEEEEVEADEEEVDGVLQALTEASEEFNNGGQLSDETLERLSQLDSRQLVETWAQYIHSQQEQVKQAQISEEQVSTIRNIAGGDQQYQEMLGWAAENLSPDEIAAYDSVMNGGDYGAMYWAAQGLKARFGADVGYEGRSYTGTRAPKAEPGFRSQAELARAIADPRYKNDPAYRMDVEEKLARSGSLL